MENTDDGRLKTKFGNLYQISEAFGVLEQLQGRTIGLLPEALLEEIKEQTEEADGEIEDIQEAAVMKMMTTKELRSFMIQNKDARSDMIATVIRSVNDSSCGKDYDERRTFVDEFLNWKDGLELSIYIRDMLKDFTDEQAAMRENSEPSSKPGKTEKAKLLRPPQ